MKISKGFKNFYTIFFFLTIGLALFQFLKNIHYNSPFNDEAIYIVLGKLGFFQHDWSSYGASSWVSGNQYLYPSLTALAYQSGGIIGSRVLNVLLAILTIEILVILSMSYVSDSEKQKITAGILTGVICAVSPTLFFLARLATMDIACFFLFFLSLVLLERAIKSDIKSGKTYFLAVLILFVSFLFKYVIIVFLPLVFIISFIQASSKGERYLFFWKRYFALPFIFFSLLIGFTQLNNFLDFYHLEVENQHSTLTEAFQELSSDSKNLWIIWAISSLGFFLKKRLKLWLILTLGALVIPVSHLFLRREMTLNKHIFFTVALLSIASGIGMSFLINKFSKLPNKLIMGMGGFLVLLILISYCYYSYQDSKGYNSLWTDASSVMEYLSSVLNPKAKVLAETGAAIILAGYPETHPENVITFDWFSYRNNTGKNAYLKAIKEGYFDFIELEDDNKDKEKAVAQLSSLVRQSLKDDYQSVYRQQGFEVFKRNY